LNNGHIENYNLGA